MLGFWPLNGNANDASGNNNNGLVAGVTPVADRFNTANSAYAFNGSSNYISTNMSGVLGNNSRAVAFWAKSSQGVAEMCAVSWGDEQTGVAGLRYECAFNIANVTGASIVGSDCALSYSPPSAVNDNNWHHYVFQFSSGALNQVQIFQDGILLSQVVYSHNPNTVLNTSNNWKVNFGRIPYSIPHYFNGSLDEIGIWNRVLTSCEIKSLYHSSATILNAASSSPTICTGQSTTLTVSGANTYTWSNNSNLTSIVVSPTATSNYTVSGTNTLTSCSGTVATQVFVSACTGLNELTVQNGFEVYPNPFSNFILVRGFSEGGILTIKLNDVFGRQLKTIEIKDYVGAFESKIDLHELAISNGIYFLNIENNGITHIKKVIRD